MSGDPGWTVYARNSISRRAVRRRRVRDVHLLFVEPARFLEIDAHNPGRHLRQKPRRADDADEIRDGERDRDVIDERGRVCRLDRKP